MLGKSGSGAVSYSYDDFGDVTESKATGYGSFENEIQYTREVHDQLTGLLYLLLARPTSFASCRRLMQETPKSMIWMRFTAEPRTGRFITRDTKVGKNTGDSDNLILIKEGLYRKDYYEMVNASMRSAYSKKQDKRTNVRKVKATLERLYKYIDALNKVAPF